MNGQNNAGTQGSGNAGRANFGSETFGLSDRNRYERNGYRIEAAHTDENTKPREMVRRCRTMLRMLDSTVQQHRVPVFNKLKSSSTIILAFPRSNGSFENVKISTDPHKHQPKIWTEGGVKKKDGQYAWEKTVEETKKFLTDAINYGEWACSISDAMELLAEGKTKIELIDIPEPKVALNRVVRAAYGDRFYQAFTTLRKSQEDARAEAAKARESTASAAEALADLSAVPAAAKNQDLKDAVPVTDAPVEIPAEPNEVAAPAVSAATAAAG